MKLMIVFIVLFSLFGCNKIVADRKSEIKYPGLVVIVTDCKTDIEIKDKNGIVMNNLLFDNDAFELKFKRGNPKIREYYPDYSIVIFDAFPLDKERNQYPVIVNDSIFYLENIEEYVIYESWNEHIKRAFIATDILNPLRENPNQNSVCISDLNYNDLSFIVLDVDGDWVYVECNNNCEGCPDGKIVKGWLQWRKKITF